ncbi:MAG: aminotransferase class V-fold PLP-dependent enzyme [Bacteroidota bacterium]|nr:aminotransferase class V-fold PLP-dependent enzyme [Candidatus Kapabacteria bacterium]MDW8219248.1 aminotransferase class V-fold PLP-dependent enzyme [Bacteroidota bacterium]
MEQNITTHIAIPQTARLECGSEALRALFPHTAQGTIYIDHASVGPLSTKVRDALVEHITRRSEREINTFASDVEHARECRARVAQLINAESAERIAFFMNTSDALNVVPSGLRWRYGERILLNDQEFPANVYPYRNLRRYGVELDILATEDGAVCPEMIERALRSAGGRIKIVALSAVQFLSGYRADVAAIGEICRQYHALFIVDAIQAAGAVPLDVQAMHIDALAAGGQKWLMAPTGIAFLYVTEELQHRIEQAHLGWLSVESPWDFFRYDQPLQASAKRYENGTINFIGILGLLASLEMLLELTPEAIERHILQLTEYLLAELPLLGIFSHVSTFAPQHRSGIVSAVLNDPTQGERIVEKLAQRSIRISLREGRLRFSPHCYNTIEEIQGALAALREIMLV